MRDRYTILVGLLFVAVAVFAIVHGVGGGGGALLEQRPPGWPLPRFAVPEAAGPLEGDANVSPDACRIHVADAIRVCDLFERPLVISFWFARGGTCVHQQDALDVAYARYRRRVSFLSLDIGDDRGTVRDLIRERGWRMPVGYDRDGAVGALYGVSGCPAFAFARPGGTLQSASIGGLTTAQLEARIERLLHATR